VELNRSSYYYKAIKVNNDAKVLGRMKELIATHKSWGLPMLHDILYREKLVINHKRTERIYKENSLALSIAIERVAKATLMRGIWP